ncbi:phosphoglycolate phosphatase [Aquamicrobium terrae]|uniref:Phosphoglycolate phosphatase n=2 Tax=Aquamicrobium terrae TaxID=1324945 RepID=A0ABV2N1I4_9HYPH
MKILHFAPEKGLATLFAELTPEGYDPVDLAPDGYRFLKVRQFDVVTDMETLATGTYDLILHSHIVEHLPISLAHFFFHVFRALKEDGVHVFAAPLMPGHYDEYLGPLSKEDATKRFGQWDHVRWLGVEDFDRHLGALMRLEKDFDLTKIFSKRELRACNIPASQQMGLHGSTVFMTTKNDYRLAGDYEMPHTPSPDPIRESRKRRKFLRWW